LKFLLIILLLLCLRATCLSQEDSVTNSNEISITIDNDIFFFIDRYYSAGHEITYRTLLSKEQFLARWFDRGNQSSKWIASFGIGNKIFTPKKVRFVNPVNMDRPYAGYVYGSISLTHLKGQSSISSLSLETGLVGEKTGLGQLQTWWHEKTGFQEPRGWDSQIANEIIFNMQYKFQRGINITREVDLVSTSVLTAGTGSNKVSQDFALRLFRFKPLTRSVFSNSLLGNDASSTKELFIFLGGGVDYVFYNIFLEGSLFDKPSPFTVESTPWVIRGNIGIMYTRNRGSFSVCFNNVGREMLNGLRHNYMRFNFSHRF
jgi:lipid A 3-O-deacylase